MDEVSAWWNSCRSRLDPVGRMIREASAIVDARLFTALRQIHGSKCCVVVVVKYLVVCRRCFVKRHIIRLALKCWNHDRKTVQNILVLKSLPFPLPCQHRHQLWYFDLWSLPVCGMRMSKTYNVRHVARGRCVTVESGLGSSISGYKRYCSTLLPVTVLQPVRYYHDITRDDSATVHGETLNTHSSTTTPLWTVCEIRSTRTRTEYLVMVCIPGTWYLYLHQYSERVLFCNCIFIYMHNGICTCTKHAYCLAKPIQHTRCSVHTQVA